mmetsp:Transcript_483/g.1111  ORF Transcript_483/g.1111 Transcript_483/m.1111 type:complete len:235 (+) Transcript_483:1099-1803(+)
MFSCTRLFRSYCPYTGFAAASTEHRALRLACIPALAMVTVCCSIASWIATRSFSPILSNSSTHTRPRSARTIAPASRRRSRVSGSDVTAAVSPTPEEPLPVVLTARGAMPMALRRSWDLAVEGSPTMRMLMSPRRWVPLARFFSQPERSCRARAFLMTSWPWMEGQTLRPRMSRISGRFPRERMVRTSFVVKTRPCESLPRILTSLARTAVGNTPDVLLCPDDAADKARYTPTT